MKKSRFSEEQIIAILKEQAAGMKTAEVCRRHGISQPTFYSWKSKFDGMEVSEAKRLKALEDENRKQPLRLRPDEWTSGDIIWLIDMLGDPRGLNLALKQLMDGPFKETDVKVAVRDRDGKIRVDTLRQLLKRANTDTGIQIDT